VSLHHKTIYYIHALNGNKAVCLIFTFHATLYIIYIELTVQ